MQSGHVGARTILYVGDREAGSSLSEALSDDTLRYSVRTADSPADAMAMLDDVGCVVSEQDLPGTDGLAFLRQVRETHADLPFVLVPADGSERLAGEAIAAGVTGYVPDGVLSTLVDRVRDVLDGGRDRRQYRTLVETVGDPMYVLDEEGYVEFANAAMAAYLDTDREAIVGTHAGEFMRQSDFEQGTNVIRQLLREGRDRDVREITVTTPGGDRRQAEDNIAILRDEDGTYRGSVGVVRDITDRKAYEQKLTRLHETTRRVVQAESRSEVADITTNAAREIVGLSIHAVWLYRPDEDALVVETITDEGRELIADPPTFGPGDGLAWQVFESGEPRTFEDVSTEPERYNPETKIRSEMILPLGDHGILIAGATEPGAFDARDVSLARLLAANVEVALDRIDQHHELREHRRRLERQNEHLDEFAGVVSHDLRNPLSVAKGRLELLAETGDIDAHLPHIDASLDRMDSLIDDLLKLARQGEAVTDREPVDIARHARRCWQNVETDGADLRVLDDESTSVLADQSRLAQLFENLFRNAVEHGSTSPHSQAREDTVEHGDDVTITVGMADDDHGFYVADDGPGIPPEERDAVFDAGYSTGDEGTGFGLSIVRKIVDAHGWDVDITESADGGARFDITVSDDD